MCGIVGYIGKKPAFPILLSGLKRLEYRGYDSYGFCVLNQKNTPFLYKKVGKISEAENELSNLKVEGNIGQAHTRWATTGKVSIENAHPHFDCAKNIYVVHNGIIENYQELKEKLVKEGHKFYSETDSVGPQTGLILFSPEGLITIKKAGSFIDEIVEKNKTIRRITEDGRIVEYASLNDWQVLTLTTEGKVQFEKINWVVRKERGNKQLINIRSATGMISITKDHSIYEYQEGYLNPRFPRELNNIVSIRRMPNMEKIEEINLIKLGDNEKINESLKVFGYLPILKLKKLLKENPRLEKYSYIDNHQILEKRGRITLPLKDAVKINIPREYLKYFQIGSRMGRTKMPVSLPLTPELGIILGFFLSEGSSRLKRNKYLSRKKQYLSADIVFCNNQNKKIINEVINAISKTFLFKPSVVKSKEKNGKITFKVCASRIVLYHFFQNVLKCGEGSDRKGIPIEILNSNKEVKKAFLKAYFLGDGSKSGHRISSTSQNIITGLRLLYWQLGIPTSSHFQKKTISGKSEYLIIPHKIKQKKYFSKGNYKKYFSWGQFTQRIHNDLCYGHFEISKTRAKPKYVYDLEVNPTHNFVTSEGIVCHNTEVLCHLIEKYFQGNLEEAVRKALREIRGTYGIAVISKKDPQKIVAARLSSPIILGINSEEFLVASDPSALITRTRQVINLDDNEIAVLKPDNFFILKEKSFETIEWTPEEAEKGGYPHFMLKEIMEQPESLKNSQRGRVILEEGMAKLGGLESVKEKLRKIERLIIVACGTAFHAGLVGEYMLEEYAGVPTEVEIASEFRYRKPILDKKTAILAISQSGETADTLAAIKEAKEKGIMTLGIVNVVGSSIARETSAGVYNHCGPEIGVASTKAFTSQLEILALLTLFLGRQREMSLVIGQRIAKKISKVPDLVREVLENSSEIEKLAKKYRDFNNFLFIGRKYNFPVALEGALKLKEIAYINAQGYGAGEMKHGPIALIDEDFPTLAICPSDSVYDKMISNIEEIKARKGKLIALATEGNKKIEELVDDVIFIPKTLEMLTPILSVIPLQLFAYYMGVLRGCDVDKPRNLAKSCTVE